VISYSQARRLAEGNRVRSCSTWPGESRAAIRPDGRAIRLHDDLQPELQGVILVATTTRPVSMPCHPVAASLMPSEAGIDQPGEPPATQSSLIGAAASLPSGSRSWNGAGSDTASWP
jgi:hypothetical protein